MIERVELVVGRSTVERVVEVNALYALNPAEPGLTVDDQRTLLPQSDIVSNGSRWPEIDTKQ